MKRFAFFLPLFAAVFLLSNSVSAPENYIPGDQAEDFLLKNVDGRMVSLTSEYPDAKGFIIVFTCNHCPYSNLYEQRLINLHRKYASQGVPVIAINPNSPEIAPEDSFENMQRRAEEKRYPFLYLYDGEQSVYPKFGATKTPHAFVLDKDRYVRYIGAIDDNAEAPHLVTKRYVENAVESLLLGELPAVVSTRAVGCTIKKKPVAK